MLTDKLEGIPVNCLALPEYQPLYFHIFYYNILSDAFQGFF